MSPEWITAISSAVTAIATVGLVFGAFWAGKIGMTPTGWAGTNPSRTPGLYRFDLRLGELIRAVSELRRNM